MSDSTRQVSEEEFHERIIVAQAEFNETVGRLVEEQGAELNDLVDVITVLKTHIMQLSATLYNLYLTLSVITTEDEE